MPSEQDLLSKMDKIPLPGWVERRDFGMYVVPSGALELWIRMLYLFAENKGIGSEDLMLEVVPSSVWGVPGFVVIVRADPDGRFGKEE